jgi:hypothetical protein
MSRPSLEILARCCIYVPVSKWHAKEGGSNALKTPLIELITEKNFRVDAENLFLIRGGGVRRAAFQVESNAGVEALHPIQYRSCGPTCAFRGSRDKARSFRVFGKELASIFDGPTIPAPRNYSRRARRTCRECMPEKS